MRAWGLPEEFWVQEKVQRSQAEKLWQAVRDIQFGRQVISRGAADAERPKLHLQPNVFAAHQGVHRRDLRKQELRIIAKIKEKCEIYLRNIVHFAAKPPRESTAKTIVFCWFSTVFAQPVVGVITPLRRVVRKLRNLAKYCEGLSFSQDFRKVFAKFFFRVSIAKHTYFRSFSHVFAVFAAHATEWFHVLSRPCFFSSCAKGLNFSGKHRRSSDLS